MRWLRLVPVAVLALLVGTMIAASALRDDSGRSPTTTTVRNEDARLSIRIPEGWHGSAYRVGEWSGLYLYSGRKFVSDPQCKGVDETVSITILEHAAPSAKTVRRPNNFTNTDGDTYTWDTLAELQCDEVFQSIPFVDEGRTFTVDVRSGRHGSDKQRDEAFAILDTFKVGVYASARR